MGAPEVNRDWLGFWFMLPAAAFLLLFLVYPLGLGIWLSFTDARIGRPGVFVGLENYEWIIGDTKFQTAVFFTLLYTGVASVFKFAIGLYLALLLNQHMPFKAIIRAVVLIPFIVPTVLSAIAFWWIFDPQFSIISWSLKKVGLIDSNINFLGDAWNARWSRDLRQRLARRAVHRDLAAGRPADRAALALRGGDARRRAALADVPLHHLSAAHADHRGGDDVLGAVHLHRLPAHQGADQRRAGRRHRADGDDVLQHAILGGIGEGAAISTAMVPFLLAAIMVSWFGLQRRKWQQGEGND